VQRVGNNHSDEISQYEDGKTDTQPQKFYCIKKKKKKKFSLKHILKINLM